MRLHLEWRTMRREVRLWIEAAHEDLVDAGDAIQRGRWFRAAFFSQQAVEKALKAMFFVVRREEPPHIHTVTELYRLLKEVGFTLPQELEEQLYILNKYYTITRYPDAANGLPSEAVDRVEAERAYNLACSVVKAIEEHAWKHS
ncbi:MAG: HEPN domain-containing protein [Candidatus Nezhaarchaeota archaeon]|nr:HEPN domain-containing protein [Candidatus Nezhaarchaeota archaeon]